MADDATAHSDVLNATAQGQLKSIIERVERLEQEKAEIAEAIQEVLKPKGVGVVIVSEHSCMTMRGVNTPGSKLTTSTLLGDVRDDPRTRQEFFDLVRNGD